MAYNGFYAFASTINSVRIISQFFSAGKKKCPMGGVGCIALLWNFGAKLIG
jgi:hypothetical protein